MSIFNRNNKTFETPERDKQFKIYQFIKIEGLKSKKKKEFEPSPFVSPIFGTTVKDVTVAPHINKDTGDKVKQLDFLREEKKIDPKEYHEFKHIFVNTETRKKIFGDDVYIDRDRKYINPLDKKPQIHVPYTGKEGEITFDEVLFEEKFIQDEAPVFETQIETLKEEPTITKTPQQIIEEEKIITELESADEQVEKDVLEVSDETLKEAPVFEPELIAQDSPIIEEFDVEQFEKEEEEVVFVKKERKPYRFPTPDMFNKVERDQDSYPEWVLKQRDAINKTLEQFNVPGEVENIIKGPTVTRHEVRLSSGINVNRVTQITNNILMDLEAKSLRIEAPIPGKPFVGLEVPNEVPEIVAFGNVVDDPKFLDDQSPLRVALGTDIDGENIYEDINKMPHGLVAGATNSGKSVCINTIIMSLLMKNHPDDLKFILIDPKRVELSAYNEIPHLAMPVVTDPKMASLALSWTVDEMERRFEKFSKEFAKDLPTYNKKAETNSNLNKLPYIVIIIDELADLMMSSPADVEDSIQRITQKARAAGIHLIVATQRPTTDVVKGTIKANILTRIAFKVSSFTDSIVILDVQGAEQLLGRGDMLLKKDDRPTRLQGAFITDDEILAVTDFIRGQMKPDYLVNFDDLETKINAKGGKDADELLIPITEFIIEQGHASLNAIQKHFGIGFNRAQEIVLMLEELNYVGPAEGRKPREVYITLDKLKELNDV